MGRKKPDIPMLLAQIEESYERWKRIYECGCTDPTWEDGVNLNLVRNHIRYHKGTCEDLLGDKYWLYPDSYFFPIPPELPNTFMAVTRPLRCSRTGETPIPSTKTIPYSEVLKFDWSEVL